MKIPESTVFSDVLDERNKALEEWNKAQEEWNKTDRTRKEQYPHFQFFRKPPQSFLKKCSSFFKK